MMVASYVHAGVLITTDIVLVVSAIYVVWSLQMKTSAKLSVAFFLMIGARYFSHPHRLCLADNPSSHSPFVATIVRTVYMSQLHLIHENPSLGTDVGIWTIIELGFCVMATAGMTLRPLAAKLKLFSSHQESGKMTAPDLTALNPSQRTTNSYPLDVIPPQDDGIRVETITTIYYQPSASGSDNYPSGSSKGQPIHSRANDIGLAC
jgi:hypothetical protein